MDKKRRNKIRGKILIIAVLFCLSFTSIYAESGPPIPTPKISIPEAIELVEEYFVSHKEYGAFKPEEYIIISANYKYFGPDEIRFKNWADDGRDVIYLENITKYWAWEIKIIHPKWNDISNTYKVTNEKQVVLMKRTE